MRNFFFATWAEYASGKIDLMSASVTTNTAFDFVRQQVDELTTRYPDLGGIAGATLLMYTTICATEGVSAEYKERTSDHFNLDLCEGAQWCHLSTYQLLDAFTRVTKPKSIPVYHGQYGWYNAKADRSIMSVREAYNDDRALLMQHLSESAYLSDFQKPLPAVDEFTRGLREMCINKSVPLWLAFAAQIFLDVNNILRSQPGKAFQDLRPSGLRTKKILVQHSKFHETLPDPDQKNWARSNEDVLKEIQSDITFFVESDWFLPKAGPANMRSGHTCGSFALYKAHPLLCGVLMFNLSLRMQELGQLLMNAWGTGMYLAHMYNSIRQDPGGGNVQWPDMDELIRLHTEERLFCRTRPTDHEESFKRLSLVMALSLGNFAGGAQIPKTMK